MGWASGVFTRARNWTADAAVPLNIEANLMDQEDDNFETGIDTCLTKDGQNTPTTNLPMGTNRHTGVGNAQAKTDYASAADVIDQDLTFYVDSGAADAYVVTPSPSIGAYEEGQRLIFRAVNANTGASTLNANALGAVAIQTPDGNALTAGMIAAAGYYEVTYDVNASPDRWVMTSPHSFQPIITAGTGMTGGGTLPASVTLNVIGGTGITANANDIATDDSAIVHDNLSGFVANEHIDHSSVSVVAGTGMTGGGTIAANRTLNVIGGAGLVANANDVEVGAGTGITVNANDVALAATAAGTGLTHSAGVLNVIGGAGLTANANDMELTDAAASTTNPIDVSSGVISFDIDGLTTIEGNALQAADTFIVSDGAVDKGIEYQDLGFRVQLAQTTQTLAPGDMNTLIEFNGTATLTLPLNSSVNLPVGAAVIVVVDHATQVVTVTAATSVTLNSINHPGGGSAASDAVIAGGTAVVIKTQTDEWYLSGDIID